MPTPGFLRSLIELATSESIDALLDDAITLLQRELGVRGYIELWDGEGARFSRGDLSSTNAAHCTWIGIRYTIGAIRLHDTHFDSADIELLARQLAPLAERLIEQAASEQRTIREDIERLYARRIRNALVRFDWNASAVARELGVGRGRVARVTRRLGHR